MGEKGFPGGTVVKNLPANTGDAKNVGSIPGSGRSPRVGNGNPLQYSCLENSMDRRAWQATIHGVAKSQGSTQDVTEYAGPLGHPSDALVRWLGKTFIQILQKNLIYRDSTSHFKAY